VIRRSLNNRVWCVLGDSNSIRCQEERRSKYSVSDYNREMREFNDFIDKLKLVDISMVD